MLFSTAVKYTEVATSKLIIVIYNHTNIHRREAAVPESLHFNCDGSYDVPNYLIITYTKIRGGASAALAHSSAL